MLGFRAMFNGIRRSRLGTLLALGYLAVFGAAECLTLATLVFQTAHSAFAGLWIIVIALPWSMMLSPLWNALGYIDWYNHFARTPLLYGLLASVTVLPGVLLNAAIAYSIGWGIERAVGRK